MAKLRILQTKITEEDFVSVKTFLARTQQRVDKALIEALNIYIYNYKEIKELSGKGNNALAINQALKEILCLKKP